MRDRTDVDNNAKQLVMPGEVADSFNGEAPRREPMEVRCLMAQTEPLAAILERRIIGQEEASEALVCAFPRVLSGLRDPSRPAMSMFLLGPTGVGKTETAKALAEALFGTEDALIRVNSEEYAHGHELAKLLGAPPGYVGQQIEPLLSQRRIGRHHRRAVVEGRGMVGRGDAGLGAVPTSEGGHELSVVLFDEIEKAHPVLWNAVLGILEGGILTLGNNETTDFTRSIIVMTSNVGSRELKSVLTRRPVGFGGGGSSRAPDAEGLTNVALEAARRTFPIEFLNRFDEILVYSALATKHLGRIFDKFLADIHKRAIEQAGVPILIKVGSRAKELILERGTDLLLGARPLRRAMESAIVDPLSRLIASHQVQAGDVVEIECRGESLSFFRRASDDTALVV